MKWKTVWESEKISSPYIFACAFYLFIHCVLPFICNCLRGHFFSTISTSAFFFFFYSTFRVWKMKAFWVRNDQGQTPEAKEYTDTVQSATDPTQTTMSAKISNNQQGKKLSNGAKEGWGGWGQREKDNTFTNSDHWEKLKQIFVVQFQRLFANMKRKCIVLLNGWGNKRTKAKKRNHRKAKNSPCKTINFTPRWKLCRKICMNSSSAKSKEHRQQNKAKWELFSSRW